jgi:flagellar motor switch protein FliN/FliY
MPEINQTADGPVKNFETLDLLLDVELPVSVSFGKTQVPLQQVLKWTTGSIVELECMVNEPVEVLVNDCVIARGEVVVVDGNYGVRVQEIVSRAQRLETSIATPKEEKES